MNVGSALTVWALEIAKKNTQEGETTISPDLLCIIESESEKLKRMLQIYRNSHKS